MKPWLTILGIGDDGLASLTAAARLHFDQAQHIILPERVRARINDEDVAGKKVTLWVSNIHETCLLYTSPSPRDLSTSRMPSSA